MKSINRVSPIIESEKNFIMETNFTEEPSNSESNEDDVLLQNQISQRSATFIFNGELDKVM